MRGGEEVKAMVSSARLKVFAQGKKRLVVALKYDGETDYRYLVPERKLGFFRESEADQLRMR